MGLRRYNYLIISLLLFTSAITSTAQSRRFTLAEATPGAAEYWALMPDEPHVLGVLPEGVLTRTPSGIDITGVDGSTKPFLSLEEWEKMMGRRFFGRLWMHGETGLLVETYMGVVSVIDPLHREVVSHFQLPSQDASFKISPKGDYLLLLEDHNIILLTPDGSRKALAEDASLDIVYGEAAHRNEFGISDGVFFTPSGRYFAFYRIDQSEVSTYPIIHWEAPLSSFAPIKYPMAGQASQKVTIGVYDTESHQLLYLKTGTPEDRYFTNIVWCPCEKKLFVEEVNREQNEVNLLQYSTESGEKLKTLHSEHHEKYIEPTTPIHIIPNSGGDYIRLSRVDGWRHLYLHSMEEGTKRQLTLGNWEVKDLLGLDKDGRFVYFTSNKDHTIGQDLYRVDIKTGDLERLTDGDGWHMPRLSPGAEIAYISFNNRTTPSETFILNLTETPSRTQISQSEDPLAPFIRPEVRLGKLSASDGSDLYYKMTLPPDMEADKKYPVIIYVYGGPHSQLVTDTWRSLNLSWDTYMAQEGYIVFTLDNRGTDHRGMDFESVTFRNLGEKEMEDQMTGVEYLTSLPFVDADRIGVYGWSFGGFMATNLMLSHPETFKVGVAGGPVMDWAFYEVMYGERYMDTPEENPSGYEKSNLIRRAGDLRGRLLLIHGALDPVVVWQHSLLFLNAAIQSGVHPDYMVYPNHEHNVRGQERVHLHTVISRYFDDFLK